MGTSAGNIEVFENLCISVPSSFNGMLAIYMHVHRTHTHVYSIVVMCIFDIAVRRNNIATVSTTRKKLVSVATLC